MLMMLILLLRHVMMQIVVWSGFGIGIENRARVHVDADVDGDARLHSHLLPQEQQKHHLEEVEFEPYYKIRINRISVPANDISRLI